MNIPPGGLYAVGGKLTWTAAKLIKPLLFRKKKNRKRFIKSKDKYIFSNENTK